ncbi:unnamed protein product [Heterobilharzia americana]|nr:unnamed protein product [Heterobilharzia americana]
MIDCSHKMSITNVTTELLETVLKDKRTLATTSFSNVYLGYWNDKNVVVKYFHEKCLPLSRKELTLISRIEHENIIKLIAAGPSLPYSCSFLVLEYADCHSLHKCFDKFRRVKLTDFGSSVTTSYTEPSIIGTLCYMAPELWTVRSGEDVPYSEKLDVYSLTITFWELLARQPPYKVLERRDVSDKFWSSISKRPPILDGCPELVNNIIQSGWAVDPQSRPTMLQLNTCLCSIIEKLFPADFDIKDIGIPEHYF